MALTKNWQTSLAGKDVCFDNAYIKVGSIAGSKKQLEAIVHILTKEDGDVIETMSFICSHEMNNKNSISQVYAYIKTLPKFDGVVDC